MTSLSIVSDSYSAVKYYSYNEYGKASAHGNSSFINDETYTGSAEAGPYFYNIKFMSVI